MSILSCSIRSCQRMITNWYSNDTKGCRLAVKHKSSPLRLSACSPSASWAYGAHYTSCITLSA